MPIPEAFLKSILANPDDDGLRLVAADWLEEHGECDRAEFIRVQVELAASRNGGMPALHFSNLRRRERELLEAHGEQWAAPVPLQYYPIFSRGFVHNLTTDWANWSHGDNAARIMAAQPIRKVRLTTQPALTSREERHNRSVTVWLAGGSKTATIVYGSRPLDANSLRRECEQLVSKLLKAEWPGIKFELPAIDFAGPAQRAFFEASQQRHLQSPRSRSS